MCYPCPRSLRGEGYAKVCRTPAAHTLLDGLAERAYSRRLAWMRERHAPERDKSSGEKARVQEVLEWFDTARGVSGRHAYADVRTRIQPRCRRRVEGADQRRLQSCDVQSSAASRRGPGHVRRAW